MNVLQLRDGLVETIHPFSAVAVRWGPDGPMVVWRGGEARHSPWRSAGKPFQLRESLRALAEGQGLSAAEADRPYSDEELAMGASSHHGQPEHVARVRGLLQRFGAEESELQCGAEAPANARAWEEELARGGRARAVHNDCSGKHSFMLGALKARGWSPDYLRPEHPLQRRIIAAVREVAGEACPTAGDGCGLPTFWLSLEGMARAWAWLALCAAEPERDPVLSRVGRAMSAHPWLISGDGHLDVALSERAREPWISKVGALAVYNIALPSRRLGIAVKVATGDESALGVAVPALVERIAPGALGPARGSWPWAKVGNVVGREVGRRLVTGLDRV